MTKVDPDKERRRLSELFLSQPDEELERIASQADELTDIAREQLVAELSRRGLPTQLTDRGYGVLELRPLVTIRRYLWLSDALLAKSSLESAGIASVLVDENVIRLDWLWSNLLGCVRLKVSPEEVEPANQLLDQAIPEIFEVDGIGTYEQPHCPACQSLDINFRETSPVAYLSLFLIPLPLRRRAWRCHSCDEEWKEEQPSESSP